MAKRRWFGPSQEEIWRQLSEELHAAFVDGSFWSGSGKVVASHGEWQITLDVHTVHAGNVHVSYTRLRAPYVNADGFRFTAYAKTAFSGIAKFFGMQDLEAGYPDFDDRFILKGTNESQIRRLFDHAPVRERLLANPKASLSVKDDEGWFQQKFPEGVDELQLLVPGVEKDLERLRELYELFAATLDRLCEIGSAYDMAPGIELS